MSDDREYLTTEALAAAAGVSLPTLRRHVKANVGKIAEARERIKGLGVRYEASKCNKYISLSKRAAGEGVEA